MVDFKIIELTKDNQSKYLNKVASLEKDVLYAMEKQGKKGQLFITGKEDILEYINSEKNSVFVAIDEAENVISATYITNGQEPFTYNDITKYFKCGNEYNEYVKSKYTKNEYKNNMLDAYNYKLEAYKYARSKVLKENSKFNNIEDFLQFEINSQNQFDEKSVLREKLNQYMSEYIESIGQNELYEQFYWTNLQDIAKQFNKKIDMQKVRDLNIKEYEMFLDNQKLIIHESKLPNANTYFKANTNNSVEIDTYITTPSSRQSGLARILVYEGIKKHMNKHFEDEKQNEIFLCSTLHRKNLSSKYVSEFFGLKDNLFVKRRHDRDREVHICKIDRKNKDKYLENIQDKLIVLYGYNPQNKQISNSRRKEILQEQLEYEKEQYRSLNKIRNNNKNYTGNIRDILNKLTKMGKLKKQIKDLEHQTINIGDGGDERE